MTENVLFSFAVKFANLCLALHRTSTIWGKLIIPTWRQQKWLKWRTCRTVWGPPLPYTGNSSKCRLLLEESTSLHGSGELCRPRVESSAKMWQIRTLPASLLTPTPLNHRHHHRCPSSGPPSAGRMSPEVASDVSSLAGQSASAVGHWWMWLVWETIRCVWSAQHRLDSACSTTPNDP